jgi:hypothetical protein
MGCQVFEVILCGWGNPNSHNPLTIIQEAFNQMASDKSEGACDKLQSTAVVFCWLKNLTHVVHVIHNIWIFIP